TCRAGLRPAALPRGFGRLQAAPTAMIAVRSARCATIVFARGGATGAAETAPSARARTRYRFIFVSILMRKCCKAIERHPGLMAEEDDEKEVNDGDAGALRNGHVVKTPVIFFPLNGCVDLKRDQKEHDEHQRIRLLDHFVNERATAKNPHPLRYGGRHAPAVEHSARPQLQQIHRESGG